MTGRYARLDQIPWWSLRKVSAGRALVVGAGALGNEVTKNLALAGWGTMVIVDRDRVERSNLTRSVMFRTEDVGRPKSVALSAGIHRVNDDVRAIPLNGDLRLAVGAGLLARVDVIFGCLDNLEARIALSQLATRTGRLYIDGALAIWEGTVRVFEGHDGPCYGCGLSADDLREITLRHSCLAYANRAAEADGVPTTPPLASAIAALMVQQALKWLHRDTHTMPVATGRELRWDAGNDRFWSTGLPINQDCPIHLLAPSGKPELECPADLTWQQIHDQACRERGPGTSIHLPLAILSGWNCTHCRASGETPPVGQTGRERVTCPNCGNAATPRRAVQVNGGEAWAGETPLSTGFPTWSWIDAYGPEGSLVIELTGSPGSLAGLADHDPDQP
jgi:molybdopterin-synthase adenylyltransferase